MTRLQIITATLVVAGAVGALLWSLRGSGPADGETPAADRVAEPGTAPRVPDSPFRTSRPATAADIPETRELAEARPETQRNRAMLGIRSDFAAKRYTSVIQKARVILEEHPDLESARAFLAMSACAVGDRDVAEREMSSLPPARQKFVSKRCQAFGMELR